MLSEGEDKENSEQEEKITLADSKSDTKSVSIWEGVKKTLSFYPKMKFALPLVFVDGLNIGTTSVIMLKIMPEYPDEKE